MSVETKVHKLVVDYCKANYEKTEVVPGKCRLNRRCHQNATHDAVTNNDKKIGLFLCIEKDSPNHLVHFANFNGGQYKDNTLGVWSKTYDYYLIRDLSEDEFFDIHKIFVSTVHSKTKEIIPWYLRLLGGDVR
jgi:hypothetical protein